MDPDYIDEDAEALAIAAAMGFSGFGKPPGKKRKFNAAVDGFVEGQELAKLDKGGSKGQGSGGNTVPLGKPRIFGSAEPNTAMEKEMVENKAGNEDEIDLGDNDEDAGPNYIDTSLPPPIESDMPPYLDEGLQYNDTARPPGADVEAREMQARIDAILARIQPSDEPEPPPSAAAGLDGPLGLPQRPAYADTAFMQGGPRSGFSDTASVASSSRPTHKGQQRGQRNELWYIDYFDPSFIENPWERLEKEKGMEPLRNWPESRDDKRIAELRKRI